MTMIRTPKTILVSVILATFMAVGIFGLMAMTGDHMHTGCPFMPGEQAICQMTVFDHISAWQSAFTATIPSVLALLLFAAVLYISFSWLDRPPNIQNPIRVRVGSHGPDIPNLLQELFSSGILNPKIP